MSSAEVRRSPPSEAPRKGCWFPSIKRAQSICPLSRPSIPQSVRQIIAELGDLLYQDPDSQEWQTADAYLSGNVRTKLVAAERAGDAYARNAEALRRVQPEDVLPGDIDANLGAPWIPGRDIEHFAAALFGVPRSDVYVGHLKKDAVWSLDAPIAAVRSVAATTDYGTERANGVWLLEQALNLRTPTIYDTIVTDGKEERVLNQEGPNLAKIDFLATESQRM